MPGQQPSAIAPRRAGLARAEPGSLIHGGSLLCRPLQAPRGAQRPQPAEAGEAPGCNVRAYVDPGRFLVQPACVSTAACSPPGTPASPTLRLEAARPPPGEAALRIGARLRPLWRRKSPCSRSALRLRLRRMRCSPGASVSSPPQMAVSPSRSNESIPAGGMGVCPAFCSGAALTRQKWAEPPLGANKGLGKAAPLGQEASGAPFFCFRARAPRTAKTPAPLPPAALRALLRGRGQRAEGSERGGRAGGFARPEVRERNSRHGVRGTAARCQW